MKQNIKVIDNAGFSKASEEYLYYSPKHNCFGIHIITGRRFNRFETEFKSGAVNGDPESWGTAKDPWILIGRCE